MHDVVIVGGGPAGSSAAIFLANKGYDVVLLEKAKFPRDKVCGDGLSGKSVGLLRELGVEEEVEKIPNRFSNGVLFSSPDGTELAVEIPPEKLGEIHGHVCRRIDFDNLLASKAKELVDFREGHAVVDVLTEEGRVVGVKVKTPEGEVEDIRAKITIGADGANSVVARKVGQGELKAEHMHIGVRAYYDGVEGMSDMIELHFIDEVLPGYFWIFPLEGKKANVGVCMLRSDQQKSRADLKKLMEDAINSPKFKERFKDAKRITEIGGWSLPLGSNRRKGYGDGFLLIGDACSLIDPFTGEGIGNAMFSAKLASEVVDEALKKGDYTSSTLRRYDEMLKEKLDKEFKVMAKLQWLARHRTLFNLALRKANKNEELKELISSTIVSEDATEERKKLTSPAFWLKVLLS